MHRGATPIPAAILAGDPETGVTLILMDEGLDTGPILAQRRVPLTGDETAPALEARLASLAAELLGDTLPMWVDGELKARSQDPGAANITRPLRREDGSLDPRRTATELERQVRAYQPWPGSYLDGDAGRIVVWRAQVRGESESGRGRAPEGGDEPPSPAGQLVALDDGLALRTRDGLLDLIEVQPAGGRRMTGAELLRGRPQLIGSRVSLRA
jgi:methionyl-tRNA formyltransferase